MNAWSSTRPARRAPPPIARAGAAVFAGLAKKTKFVEPALAENWPALAGEKLAGLCRPGRLTGRAPGKSLELRVPSGAAAAAVQMDADGLIARLNAYLGPGAVGRISIVQSGPAARPKAGGGPAGERPEGATAESPLGAALASFRAAIARRNPGGQQDP